MAYHKKTDRTEVMSFTLPKSTCAALDRIVPSGERSRFVASLINAAISNHVENPQLLQQATRPQTGLQPQ